MVLLGVESGSVRVREGISSVGEGLVTAWVEDHNLLGSIAHRCESIDLALARAFIISLGE